MFSYLPDGTPPWPTSVPAKTSSATLTETRTLQVDAPPVPKKRSLRSLLPTIALLILTPIIGVGITLGILFANGQFSPSPAVQAPVNVNAQSPTPTPAAQATVTTPKSFQQGSNKEMNISYQYPSDWQVDPVSKNTGSTSIDFHSSSQYNIYVYIIRFTEATSANYSTNNAVNDANLQSLVAQGLDVQPLQTDTPKQQIGGISWDQEEGYFIDASNNSKIHVTTMAAKHGKEYYTIVLLMPDMIYKSALAQDVMPMLNGLKFLS